MQRRWNGVSRRNNVERASGRRLYNQRIMTFSYHFPGVILPTRHRSGTSTNTRIYTLHVATSASVLLDFSCPPSDSTRQEAFPYSTNDNTNSYNNSNRLTRSSHFEVIIFVIKIKKLLRNSETSPLWLTSYSRTLAGSGFFFNRNSLLPINP